ncbi:hypothetical protein [Kitasatospora sp. DSM 101779]|nr:hypothetical protein [Kitasatospora sp. DSM 101779]MCU7820455.1 hypothetical protein [Kitasatospora sp. DSM 101779]
MSNSGRVILGQDGGAVCRPSVARERLGRHHCCRYDVGLLERRSPSVG